MALGASHAHVLRKAIQIGLEPALIGASVGIIAAIVTARTLESFLLGASGVDFQTYAICFVFFALCAVLAGLAAAWPLRRLSPKDALKEIAH
jgi:ABC-type antimicrobial peptide transport system permease subunit